ncbi:TetR/AcrR family transcriptional regulator [Nannocystis punicea]|uniref:TetR/AcrR family transcriptional regulator n=1 Tax=Nannocystis punicea TaxID=2995304 RepID=A0ABY7GUK2_9BACT|nr:TetR/AcrR family transcriptional regulator [Nannocystis poenicansa]WAS90645.1 TetR/AcrR family transcriptional regulator [Nannocystis poenicansa]
MGREKQTGTVRERLLRAADELFYREGIHVVGIDRILAHAGVAKASLYGNFKSKDELVRAYLEDRSQWLKHRIEERISQSRGARERIVAAFDEFADRVAEAGSYHGCAFIRACAEGGEEPSAAQEVSSAFRLWRRELFTRLAEEGGLQNAEDLSRRLCLIYDGAAVAVAMDCDPAAAVAARGIVEQLLDSYQPKEGNDHDPGKQGQAIR